MPSMNCCFSSISALYAGEHLIGWTRTASSFQHSEVYSCPAASCPCPPQLPARPAVPNGGSSAVYDLGTQLAVSSQSHARTGPGSVSAGLVLDGRVGVPDREHAGAFVGGLRRIAIWPSQPFVEPRSLALPTSRRRASAGTRRCASRHVRRRPASASRRRAAVLAILHLGDEALGAVGVQADGAADGALDVVVAVDPDPVRAALDPVERAAGAITSRTIRPWCATTVSFSYGITISSIVRSGKRHPMLLRRGPSSTACSSCSSQSPQVVGGGAGSNRSASRISAVVIAGAPVGVSRIRCSRSRLSAPGSSGPGLTYSSRFTSTDVPRGSSPARQRRPSPLRLRAQPDRQW